MAVRHALNSGMIVAVLVGLGCTPAQLAHRTLYDELNQYPRVTEGRLACQQYRRWAKKEWSKTLAENSGTPYSDDYGSGFLQGFVDQVYAGGIVEPPAIPPRKYWRLGYRNEQGRQAIENYYNGFEHGARVAKENGYRERAVVPSSLFMNKDDRKGASSVLQPPSLDGSEHGVPIDTSGMSPPGSDDGRPLPFNAGESILNTPLPDIADPQSGREPSGPAMVPGDPLPPAPPSRSDELGDSESFSDFGQDENSQPDSGFDSEDLEGLLDNDLESEVLPGGDRGSPDIELNDTFDDAIEDGFGRQDGTPSMPLHGAANASAVRRADYEAPAVPGKGATLPAETSHERPPAPPWRRTGSSLETDGVRPASFQQPSPRHAPAEAPHNVPPHAFDPFAGSLFPTLAKPAAKTPPVENRPIESSGLESSGLESSGLESSGQRNNQPAPSSGPNGATQPGDQFHAINDAYGTRAAIGTSEPTDVHDVRLTSQPDLLGANQMVQLSALPPSITNHHVQSVSIEPKHVDSPQAVTPQGVVEATPQPSPPKQPEPISKSQQTLSAEPAESSPADGWQAVEAMPPTQWKGKR